MTRRSGAAGPRWQRAAGYALAAGAVGAALLARMMLDPLVQERAPFIIFVLAVMVAAGFGGRGPGLAAIAASVLLGVFFLLEPRGAFVLQDLSALVHLGLFVAIGLGVVLVTGRLRAAEGARDIAEESYRTLVEAVEDYAVFSLDEAGCIATWNRGAEALTGYPAGEVLGRHVGLLDTKEALGRTEAALAAVRRDGRHEEEAPRCRRDGSCFDAHVVVTRLRQADRPGFAVVIHDVTARRAAQSALAASEARLRMALGAAGAGAWEWDVARDRTTWSDEYYALLGLAPGAVEAGTAAWLASVHPEDRDRARRELEETVAVGRADFAIEFRVTHPTLGQRWLLGTGRADYAPDGTPLRVAGLNIDVTRRRAAEDALRAQGTLLRTVVDTAVDPIYAKDPQGRFLFANRRVAEVLGAASPDAMVGRTDADFLPADAAAHIQSVDRAVLAQRGTIVIEELVPEGGEMRVYVSAKSPILDAGGQVAGLVGVSRDITERVRAEAEVRRLNEGLERTVAERTRELTETVTELDAFAYTVSHDLRAPLRAMEGFAAILLEDHAEELGEDARHYATRIVAAARRMDELIEDLLGYSRLSRSAVQLGPVPLGLLLRGALADVAAQVEAAGATVEVAEPLPEVVGSAAILRHMLANLIGNAAKFIPPDEKPVIRIVAEPSAAAPGRVRVVVEDNGIGVLPEHRDRIFHVFERLHPDSDYPGTGIGLAIVRRGAERLGGSAGVDPRPDGARGSRFWIELGLAEGVAREMRA
jgi:PAS domain S-box-containing protein